MLLTTIGLGTSKPIATYRGSNSLSTTIEWILGVVTFLVLVDRLVHPSGPSLTTSNSCSLHSAGVYNSEENVPGASHGFGRKIAWSIYGHYFLLSWTSIGPSTKVMS